MPHGLQRAVRGLPLLAARRTGCAGSKGVLAKPQLKTKEGLRGEGQGPQDPAKIRQKKPSSPLRPGRGTSPFSRFFGSGNQVFSKNFYKGFFARPPTVSRRVPVRRDFFSDFSPRHH